MLWDLLNGVIIAHQLGAKIMGMWTQIDGVILYDESKDKDLRKKYEKALGRTFTGLETGQPWDEYTSPCGQEGSLQWHMLEDNYNHDRNGYPIENHPGSYVVIIEGSLRNMHSGKELTIIKKWFGYCVLNDDFQVRSAVLQVILHDQSKVIYTLSDGELITLNISKGNTNSI